MLTLYDCDSSAALLGLPALAHSETSPVRVAEQLESCVEPVDAVFTVADRGRVEQTGDGHGAEIALVVLRGPCSLAVCSLMVSNGPRWGGIVVVHETGRSLTTRDVTDVA